MEGNLDSTNDELVDFDVGDLVWAKMRGYPPWPGKVSRPICGMKESGKKNTKCVYFFGSGNYGWIDVGCLKPYSTFKDALSYSYKSAGFKNACKAIETYILECQEPLIPISSLLNDSFGSQSTSNSDSKNELPNKRWKYTDTNSNSDVLTSVGLVNSDSTLVQNDSICLNKPDIIVPESAPLDVSKISESLINKKEKLSVLTFGLISLGDIGSGLALNLLSIGHKVVVWSPSPDEVEKLLDAGAVQEYNLADVLEIADITFSCNTDPQVVKDIVNGICSIYSEMKIGKAFVEISGIDAHTSQGISDAITSNGGRYLEVVAQGNTNEADKGNLVFMAGGDKTLFDEWQLAFNDIAQKSFYFGEIGAATKMNMILHSIEAISLAGLVEAMALAKAGGISPTILINILGFTSLKSPLMMEKGEVLVDHLNQTSQAFKVMHKDVSGTIKLSESLELSCPVNTAVNEMLKCAKLLGQGDYNVSALYTSNKF